MYLVHLEGGGGDISSVFNSSVCIHNGTQKWKSGSSAFVCYCEHKPYSKKGEEGGGLGRYVVTVQHDTLKVRIRT